MRYEQSTRPEVVRRSRANTRVPCTSIQRGDRCASSRNSFLPPPDPSSRGHSYNHRRTGSSIPPVFPSSHFPPLRRDGKIRAISVQMQMRPKKSSKKLRVLTGERRAFPYGGAINLEILDLRSACFAFQL